MTALKESSGRKNECRTQGHDYMSLSAQIVTLFLLAIPVACVAWTVTHEDVFREPAVSRVDFRFAREVGSVRWEADLLNAFNAHYNELGYVLLDFKGRPNAFEYPAPGRALRIGMTWSLSRRRNG